MAKAEDDHSLLPWSLVSGLGSRTWCRIITDYFHRFGEALPILAQWVRDGAHPLPVDVVDGIENVPQALARLFEGRNIGKQLVRVSG